jgi:hypothetical protein
MVSPTESRPAPLTQREVEALAGGRDDASPRALHLARSTPPATRAAPITGSRPIALTAQEVTAIRRTAALPSKLAQRIAAATPSPPDPPRGKAKSKSKNGGAPTLVPKAGEDT